MLRCERKIILVDVKCCFCLTISHKMAPVIEAAILGSFIFREAKFLDTAFNLGEIAAAAAIFAVVVNPLNADIFFLKHDSSTFRQSSNHIWSNSTEPNLSHRGETTHRVGRLSENVTDML